MSLQTTEAPAKRKGRVRTVFGSHSNTAHVWAQQTYSVGYASDRRVYFEGATIFSYGRHYAMASFTDVVDAEGKRIVLFKADGYSISTSKHRHHALDALNGLRVRTIYVEGVNASPERNARAMVLALEQDIPNMANPVKWREVGLRTRLVNLQQRCARIRDFMELFDVTDDGSLEALETSAAARITEAMNAFNDPAKVAKRAADKRKRDTAKAVASINETLAALQERKPEPAHANVAMVSEALELWLASGRAIETAAPVVKFLQQCLALREQEALANVRDPNAANVLNARRWASYSSKPTVTVEEWLEGEGHAYALGYTPETLVRRKGERLETSRGVEVPFKHAVFAYLKAAQCRREGTTWHRNGEKVAVGVYQLDAIDAEGNITAGCHSIAFAEMQRLAVREVPELVRASFPLPAIVVEG